MKSIRSVLHAFRDLLILYMPHRDKGRTYDFAFIVHPRGYSDLTRKYPIFRYLPKFFSYVFTMYCWPVVLSKIVGLKSQIDGKDIYGYVITVPMTARQMIEDRARALKRITQACQLAKNLGANIVGLGGLTSSFSRGGLDLIDKVDINITTGHAYTSYNVTENVFALTDQMGLDKKNIWVGIVGAAGSVGSTSAKLITRAGYTQILLVDLERKHHLFVDLIKEMKVLNPDVIIETTHQIGDIKKCDIIVAATNAPEALIKATDLKWGAIIVDDAQPSDVHEDVFARKDVLVTEAGVTHTPGITNNFNFGLKDRKDNFCCLAEVFILAANEWDEHYVINRATLQLVDEIAELGRKLDFKIGKFQNFRELITDEKMSYVKQCIQKNGIQN